MEQNNSVSEPQYFVVIGASAGGLPALELLVSRLHEDMDAAYFVVLHLSKAINKEYLANRLSKSTTLPCLMATEGTIITKGNIYLAKPNEHLLVSKGRIKIGLGAEENRWRPSIDVLFRSAAVAYGTRTIGVILSGMLDDGTAGMSAIKRCGGSVIIQDPEEAEFPGMPKSVLQNMEVDFCKPAELISTAIKQIIKNKNPSIVSIPHELLVEAEISERSATGIDVVSQLGDPSLLTCPDCGGVLFQLDKDNISRYRCHTGHAYSVNDLLLKQSSNVESALWVALRSLEERHTLLKKLNDQQVKRGYHANSTSYAEKTAELRLQIEKLKDVLIKIQVGETDN